MEKTVLFIQKYCGYDVGALPLDELEHHVMRARYARALAVSEIAEALSKVLQ